MCKGMQQSYINAGSLFFFSGGVSPSFRTDVLDCSLYSQLAASAKAEKFAEPVEWRQTCLDALTRFRCDITYREVQDAPLEYAGSLWGYVREKLTGRVPLSLIERAEHILKCFANGTGDADARALLIAQTMRCQPLLESAGAPDTSGLEDCSVTLQLGFVDVEPLVNLIILSFDSTPPVGEASFAQLFTPLDGVNNLELATVSAELDVHGFGYFRKDLIARLGARRDQLIVGLGEGE